MSGTGPKDTATRRTIKEIEKIDKMHYEIGSCQQKRVCSTVAEVGSATC